MQELAALEKHVAGEAGDIDAEPLHGEARARPP